MKMIIALAFALSASSAMALSQKSSWSEIFASGATLIFEENLGQIALNNACLTATEVQSISAVKHCEKLVPVEVVDSESSYTDWVCEKWTVSKMTYPRTTKKSVCAEYTYQDQNLVCVEYADVAVTVGETINVSVVEDKGEYSTPGFTKQYTFPSCQ